MNKYGTYITYYCKETKEYFRIPHSDSKQTLEKYAEQGLTLEEVRDPYEPSEVHIIQPW